MSNTVTRGGGVLIAVSKDLKSELCETIDNNNIYFEQLFVLITIGNSTTIIGGFYSPPSSDLQCYEDHICSIQECLILYPNSHIIITGLISQE